MCRCVCLVSLLLYIRASSTLWQYLMLVSGISLNFHRRNTPVKFQQDGWSWWSWSWSWCQRSTSVARLHGRDDAAVSDEPSVYARSHRPAPESESEPEPAPEPTACGYSAGFHASQSPSLPPT